MIFGVLVIVSLTILFYQLPRATYSDNSSRAGSLELKSDIEIAIEHEIDFPHGPQIARTVYSATSIDFPSGENVDLTLLSYVEPQSSIQLISPLSAVIDDLIIAANEGDIGAASVLGNNLLRCSSAPRSKDDYSESVLRLGGSSTPEEFREIELEMLLENYEMCKGLSDDKVNDYLPWLKLAAEGGDVASINSLFSELGMTRETGEIVNSAWEQGFIGMGHSIAMLHSQGLMTESGVPDNVSAYAYAYATNLVWGKAYEVNNSPYVGNSVSDLQTALDGMIGSRLSPQEQIEAEELAYNLLKGNKKCCIGTWQNYGLNPAIR